MDVTLPLPALLSNLLVAFTVEFDNEAEHRLVHSTTTGGGHGPWLVSQVMWANVIRYVDDGGTRVDELRSRARTERLSLPGLTRWGYVVVREGAGGPTIHLSGHGRRAREIWEPLTEEIEARWATRFAGTDALTASLRAVTAALDVALPDYLPIVYPTQNGRAEIPAPGSTSSAELPALVSQVLLAFTLDFEVGSRISLPVSANTLRVLGASPVRVRDLPALTGVSKEANAMTTGFLVRHACATILPDPSGARGRAVTLTPKGAAARRKFLRVLAETDAAWRSRFGDRVIDEVRTELERVVRHPALREGMEPYPDGWRAKVRRPEHLPQYPMVLHRGGYPDGS